MFRYIRSYAEVTTEFSVSDIAELEAELSTMNMEYKAGKGFRLELFSRQQKFIRYPIDCQLVILFLKF